jgi:ferric-dicitrate binding protein FerR (iron transport regulator)
MNIEEFLRSLPSKNDIADAVGLQARTPPGQDLVTAFGLFGTGIMLGAGLGLLFAIKPGQELRKDIADKVGEVEDRLLSKATNPTAPSLGASTHLS